MFPARSLLHHGSMPLNRCLVGVSALLAACGVGTQGGPTPESESRQALNVTHTFDFATQMPPHLAVMFSMSWFGIPASDPQGAGPDPSYGNAKWGGGMIPTNDPATCTTCILEGASDTCLM